jgi:translation initiation factor 2B subunit (eIF-2B alpha/beta/delta family)
VGGRNGTMADGALPRHWLLRALDLETDRKSGAGALSLEAVKAFGDAVNEAWTPDADPAAARAQLQDYARRLMQAQPSMAPLATRLERCSGALGHGREAALAEVEAVLRDAEASRADLVLAAAPLFSPGLRVLTLSFSQTVLDLLTRYSDRLEGVTVCESRPLSEGVRLAEAIGALAIPARLITEAQLELFIRECDCALVGADRILPGGEVVNKAGTAVLARLCAAHGLPFYAAADRSRWVPEGHPLAVFRRERRSPAEVIPDPPVGVEVANIPFDLTPASLVTAYVTEHGIDRRLLAAA